MRYLVLLLMLSMCGCAAAAAPVALGTGSAVADMLLAEVIRAGAAEVAPQAVAMVTGGVNRLAYFGGNPKWARLIPGGRQPVVQRVNGMTFVGSGW